MRPLAASMVDSPASCSGRMQPITLFYQHQRPRPSFRSESMIRHFSKTVRCEAGNNGKSNGVYHAVSHEGVRETDVPLVWTKFVAETLLPTGQGKFRLRGYRHTIDGGRTFTEPSAIISGSVEGLEEVVVRVHDACFTSEVLGSLKCDCREQLQLALDYIQDAPPGMVIYLQQEGRGIGLANKIAAYSLQEKGLDTVDANRALGLPDDCREYSAVGHILQELGVKSIRLMTNNPRKINELAALGINVVDRVPCQVKSHKYNRGYLSAKQRRMKHILRDDEEELSGQYCFWDHDGEPSSAGIPLQADMELESAENVLEPAGAAPKVATAVHKAAMPVLNKPVAAPIPRASIGLANQTRTGTASDFECGGSAGKSA